MMAYHLFNYTQNYVIICIILVEHNLSSQSGILTEQDLLAGLCLLKVVANP